LSVDTGEGRFVNIRGIDGNLNGATFGGAVLLNTNANGTAFNSTGRAVEFDTIPTGSIDRLVVTKSRLPDQEAEGIGGSVELTPRSAMTHKGFFFDGQLGEGYEPARKTTNLTDEVAIGDSFGDNGHGGKLFHIVLAQNEHNDGRGFDDLEAGYLDSPDQNKGLGTHEDKVVSSYELRRYRYHRERYGFYGELDITPNDSNRIYLRGSLAGYQERVNRQRILINGLDGTQGSITIDPNNPNGFAVTGATAQNTLRDEVESHRNLALQAGGEHSFNAIKFDWRVSYIHATFNKPFDYNSTFNNLSPGFNVTYDNLSNPTEPIIKVSGANLADPTQYALSNINTSSEYAQDREFSYAANLTMPIGLAPGDSFKFGAELRYRHKYDLDAYNNNLYNYNGTGQLLSTLQGDGPFTNYYGMYNIGYAGNAPALAALYNANAPAPNVCGVAALEANSPSCYNLGNYTIDDNEDISAGYAQYHGKFNALDLVVGVRLEHTRSVLGGLQFTPTTTNYQTEPHNYTNAFPTLQLKYQFSPRLVARAGYTTSLSRPGFKQTQLYTTIDQNGSNGTVGNVVTGNPNLAPMYSHNFDATLEYYLPGSGIISLGVFDKEIRNFIVARQYNAAYPQAGAGIYHIVSFENATSTYVRGIEA
ncbi:MAG: TonB-dependent receptor, partial [Alphaproteobacteria bacterium]|nr:TonB-dependent receptor [Alphaproteobacteria bacterium]